MKIAIWNCNGSLRTKTAAIDRLEADILVIAECEDPARSSITYREWAGQYLWHGHNKNRGLGVFSPGAHTLTRLDWEDHGLQLFLPCRIAGNVVLLAVWTKHAQSPTFEYIGQLWKYLKLHKHRLVLERFVIGGDWNSNARWDLWDRWWNHGDVVRELEELGARSVYHTHFGEIQGQESRPTLYHRHDVMRPYHVDHAFASSSLKTVGLVGVGKRDDWLEWSDHMPLTFSIES